MSLRNSWSNEMVCDYHLHSEYSFDSSEKIENICEKAVQTGINEIALTDHAEFPLRETAPWPDFTEREAVITACREKYGAILTIRSGIETGQPWRDAELEKKLMEAKPDFVIASVHELDGYSDPHTFPFSRENTEEFICTYLAQMTRMASTCDYDVIGHVTYLFRFIPEQITAELAPEYFTDLYEELFKAVIARGKGIEVNCSGLRMPSIGKTMPSAALLKMFRELGGEIVTVGSDGHSCRSAFSGLEAGYEVLREAGFFYASAFQNRNPSFYKL